MRIEKLACVRQKDDFSCAILAFNAIEHVLDAVRYPLLNERGSIALSRLQKMKAVLAQHLYESPHPLLSNDSPAICANDHKAPHAQSDTSSPERMLVTPKRKRKAELQSAHVAESTSDDGPDSSTASLHADDGAATSDVDMDSGSSEGRNSDDSDVSEAESTKSEATKSDAMSHNGSQPKALRNQSILHFFQPVQDKDAWRKQEAERMKRDQEECDEKAVDLAEREEQ
ncbi:hypothetical protein EWM64_g2015 [Hericium alpestre]|uniref:Ubiquitin-like protease family profile domain-containing protein n=1 Tax=Hericium alpestre TaxID=135208 RepID=A0A4Z0A687_9AGAM|nr:hypothetical protein EWM64_g2015 [Hericium alpestre]